MYPRLKLGFSSFSLVLILGLATGCAVDPYGSVPSDNGAGGAQHGGGGSGAQGGGGLEDCQNGKDDDKDGQADCADSECGAFACTAGVPAGWNAVSMVQVDYPAQASPPNCPDGKLPSVHYAEPASTSNCSACTCQYQGATCTSPHMACSYTAEDCSGTVDFWVDHDSCTVFQYVPEPDGGGSCKIVRGPDVKDPGTCAGGTSDKMGPPMWGKEIHLCARSAGAGQGCNAGETCAPKPGGVDQDASICIVHSGAEACPSGWSNRIEAYDGGTDDRSCSNCGCDTKTVTCAGGSFSVADHSDCSSGGSGSKLVDAQSGCVTFSGVFDKQNASFKATLGTPQDGTCTQATPQGSVQTSGPRTLCCR